MKGLLAAIGALAVCLATPAGAAACSPPFNPTIAALGPGQIVLVGTTGERVDGGRLFHVERVFNGSVTTPVVIAFKEGEPVGDCSYPVSAGEHKVIAPYREDDGRLSADLGTLQADPESEAGIAYLAEAVQLYGNGAVPAESDTTAPGPDPVPTLLIGATVILGLVLVTAFALRARARSP